MSKAPGGTHNRDARPTSPSLLGPVGDVEKEVGLASDVDPALIEEDGNETNTRLPQTNAAVGFVTHVHSRIRQDLNSEGGCDRRSWVMPQSSPVSGFQLLLGSEEAGSFQLSQHSSASFYCWSSCRTIGGAWNGGQAGGLETFLVSLYCSGSSVAAEEDADVDPEEVHDPIARFRAQCQKALSPLLPRPVITRVKRKKKTPPTTVRRSARINGHLTGGLSVKEQQQRTLMIQLGIAREGEVIGNDA
ncbi:hypothetical protein ZWY2020_050969 [Hordeum vulgare]|nr:hypothetical protein ZWY2020_050969 [Hordeum vulgare]